MWQYGLLNQPPQGYPDRDCHELYSMEIKRVKKETENNADEQQKFAFAGEAD